MRRNAFNEPQPATFDEIAEAMEEVFGFSEDLNVELQAQVFDGRYEPAPHVGFYAEISGAETGEPRFTTCGFPDKWALIEGLNNVGIVLIEDCT